jgi:hypothetical protein
MKERDIWTDYEGDFVDWDHFIRDEDYMDDKYFVDDKIYIRITGVYLDTDMVYDEDEDEGDRVNGDDYFEDVYQYEIKREWLEDYCVEDYVRDLLCEDVGYWCISSYNGEILNPTRLIRDIKLEELGI